MIQDHKNISTTQSALTEKNNIWSSTAENKKTFSADLLYWNSSYAILL